MSGVTKQDATITRDAPKLDGFLRGVLKSNPGIVVGAVGGTGLNATGFDVSRS